MKKTIITIFTLLVISASSTKAQAVWGLRAGLSVPRFTSKDSSIEVKNSGWEIGPVVYYSLKNDFYINTGIMYSMKKIKNSGTLEGVSLKSSTEVSYFDIPFYLGYLLFDGRFYTQLGPYLGIKISEKESVSSKQFSEKYEGNMNSINSYNAGLCFMYGAYVKRFKIELGYQYGLINFFNDTVDNDVKLNSWFLGVSYIF